MPKSDEKYTRGGGDASGRGLGTTLTTCARVDFAEEKAKKMIMSDVRRHPTMMSLRGRASFVSRFAKLKAACRTDLGVEFPGTGTMS